MSKAKQNLTKRIKQETNEAKSRRLVERLSKKKRERLGLGPVLDAF